jgi:hypothetical protein
MGSKGEEETVLEAAEGLKEQPELFDSVEDEA